DRTRSANEAMAEPKRNIIRAFPDQDRTGEAIGQDEGGLPRTAGHRAPILVRYVVPGVVTMALRAAHITKKSARTLGAPQAIPAPLFRIST
ncbi:MAG TPA: hypothetical protein VGD13_04110, partial [Xanthobacteraceae bacterium]